MKEKQKVSPVRLMAEIGIIAALGFVIDELQSAISRGLFVNGGSIGFAMVAVIIMAYRRGFLPALATGFIMSLLDTATGPYILPGTWFQATAQVALDYVLAYPVVALAGLFKPAFDNSQTKGGKATWLIVGCLVGGFAKFAVHYAAGAIFWADPSNFAWDLTWMNPYLYVFVYNIAYMGPCIVLSTLIAMLIFWRAPSLYQDPSALYRSLKERES